MSNTYDQDYDKINSHNREASNKEIAGVAIGGLGATIPELMRGITSLDVDIYQYSEGINEFLNAYSMHGKGAFEAICYASVVSMFMSGSKSEKGFKTGDKNKSIKKDFSLAAATITMATGRVWEAISLFASNTHGVKSTHYDMHDIAYYAIGVTAFAIASKLADQLQKSKYFNGEKNPFTKDNKTPTPAIPALSNP